jgi:ADP-L-glycero-D-manno-heptose 6-epimerase
MSSVVFKSFHQIKDHGQVKLFKSHNPDYQDGEQCRDFVYVKDCVKVMLALLNKPEVNGIFNLGSGKARTWKDLVRAVFSALQLKEKIEYIPMPEELRGRYQYFTESDMQRLQSSGIEYQPCSLEDGVKDYVLNYLVKDWPQW